MRTALVYAGRLTKSVRGNGYFDAIVDAASLLRIDARVPQSA